MYNYCSFLNIPATKNPITAPYSELLIGLEVIVQVPLEQPGVQQANTLVELLQNHIH